MATLAGKDPTPEPGLHPFQGVWKVLYREQSSGERGSRFSTHRTKQFVIDLPLMFEWHNDKIQAKLKVWDLLPEEGSRDENGKLLMIEPTAEDAQHFSDVMLQDPIIKGWITTSSLLLRIQDTYTKCGPPPRRIIPNHVQPDLLVVEDDLGALVKMYHYYRGIAELRMQAMRLAGNRRTEAKAMKEIEDIVMKVINMREAVRVAKGVTVEYEVDTKKNDSAQQRKKAPPRLHPIAMGRKYMSHLMQMGSELPDRDGADVLSWKNQVTTSPSAAIGQSRSGANNQYIKFVKPKGS
jgi:hypothetical protein